MEGERIGEATLYLGDCRDVLRALVAQGIRARTCITSPPYWGLRDYGVDGQIGLEPTLGEFVQTMVEVFRGVRDVLTDDGTLWLNLGDTYISGGGIGFQGKHGERYNRTHTQRALLAGMPEASGLKPKDLAGVPWRVAFALQADGWYLRSDVIWHKPNPMPESVTDRPTKSHEYLFLFSKRERYFYDAEAIKEHVTCGDHHRNVDSPSPSAVPGASPHSGLHRRSGNKERRYASDFGRPDDHAAHGIPWEGFARNRRTVWTVATQPFGGAHFATFPPALIEPCVLAGSERGDVVLDPFNGAGTTGLVALRNGRRYIGVELNPAYVALTRERFNGPEHQTRLFG